MSEVREYKLCKCGNKDMISNYNYKSEELYESCDVCGYFHTKAVINMPEGDIPEGWKPEYQETEGTTGFVVKIFGIDKKGFSIASVEKDVVKDVIKTLKKDNNVIRFAITFKDNLGNIQTQIYNKNKYRVTYLIDVVSKIPSEYTKQYDLDAESEIDALKKVATIQTEKDSPNIDWIKSLDGTYEDVKNQLMICGYYFTKVEIIKKD